MSRQSDQVAVAVCVLFFEKVDQTIECVRAFAPAGVPIYVLNNGSASQSRDRLADALRDVAHVNILDADRNMGVAVGRNYLVAQTAESWLLMVDSDITVRSADWLGTFRAHVARDAGIEVFTPRLFDVNRGRYDDGGSLGIRRGRLVYRRPGFGVTNRFPGGSAFVSRRVFDRLGLYDEQMFVGYEDIELAIRAIRSGYPIQARLMRDLTFFHDHRPVTTLEDRVAALERYNPARVEASFMELARKHNLAADPRCADWSKAQLRRMLNLDGSFRFEVKERIKRRLLDRFAES